MPQWTLADDATHLLRDSEPDFLLMDTLWAALHRADMASFLEVLDLRRQQGFSGVMMSILPIAHDRSGDLHHPFPRHDDGTPDFSRLDPTWLDRAEAMIEAVVERDLVPMLMLQWVNYVPDTWASVEAPQFVMSDEETLAMVEAVVARFARFRPIWSTSGDETFISRAAIDRHVLIARRVRELDDGLITAHTGGWIHFPEEINELVDFIGYQSGHDGANWKVNPQQWNRYLATLSHRHPAMNLEPPYEGHGYNSGEGRYRADDVRLASWRSVLTGAGAGLAYGAHGLWSWHHAGEEFSSEDWSGMPFDAMVALRLPGAPDVGWLRERAVEHRFWELVDRGDLVVRDRSGITVGATKDLARIVVHAPHPFRFEIQVDETAYDVIAYDICSHARVPVQRFAGESGKLNIATPERCSEHLYVLHRR